MNQDKAAKGCALIGFGCIGILIGGTIIVIAIVILSSVV